MKVSLGLCLALAVILGAAPASAVEPFVLYDDFKSPLLDPDKWFGTEEPNSILEVFRGTSSNRLVMANRAYGEADTNVGRVRNTLSTRFTGGAAVTAIKATVKMDALEVTDCPTNPSEPIFAFARLLGDFFNTGAGSPGSGPGSAVDDVFAAIGLERNTAVPLPGDVVQVSGFIRFCADAACLTGAISSVVLGTVAVGKEVTLLLQWDPANNQFIFQKDNEPQASIAYAVADAAPPARPVQALSVQHFVPNCDLTGGSPPARPTAFMRALFGDVFVNAGAGFFLPPTVSLDVRSLFFGTTLGVTSAPQTVTLTNTGGVDVTISSIVSTNSLFIASQNCLGTLAPGASCSISLQFQGFTTSAQGILIVSDDAVDSPQTVHLVGNAFFVPPRRGPFG